jgi:hypothetical protein
MKHFVLLCLLLCASGVTRQSASADTIDVIMTDIRLRMPIVLYLDDTVFRIQNRGTIPHNFLIHNADSSVFYYFADGDGELDNIRPGETRLMVTGMLDTNYAYKAMCPLDEHDDQGIVEYFSLARSLRPPRVSVVEALPDGPLHMELGTDQVKLDFNVSWKPQLLSVTDVRASQVYSQLLEPGRSEILIDRALLGSGLRFVRIGRHSLKLFLTPF